MDDFRKRDPVLRLLPEVPDSFAQAPPEEQAWRGRMWLMLYGAGYEPDHAWWFVSQDPKVYPDIEDVRKMLEEVPDEHYPHMVYGRKRYEEGKAMVSTAPPA